MTLQYTQSYANIKWKNLRNFIYIYIYIPFIYLLFGFMLGKTELQRTFVHFFTVSLISKPFKYFKDIFYYAKLLTILTARGSLISYELQAAEINEKYLLHDLGNNGYTR